MIGTQPNKRPVSPSHSVPVLPKIQLSKPPGLFADPIPFKILTNHHNPTIYNFPSFSTAPISTNLPHNAQFEQTKPKTVTNNSPSTIVKNGQRIALKNIIQPPQVPQNIFQQNGNVHFAYNSQNRQISIANSIPQTFKQNTPNSNSFPPPPPYIPSQMDNEPENGGNGAPTFTFGPPFSANNPSEFPSASNFPSLFPGTDSSQLPDIFGAGFSPGNIPFDPTFPEPPKPKRFQPQVGGSCISFTGERGKLIPF